MSFTIERGPKAESLVEAFLRAYDRNFHTVRFWEGRTSARVKITALEYQSIWPGEFLFIGFQELSGDTWVKVKGFYNCNDQTGHFSRIQHTKE